MSVANLATPRQEEKSAVFASHCGSLLSTALDARVDLYTWAGDWHLILDQGVTTEAPGLTEQVAAVPLEQRDVLALNDSRHLVIPFDSPEGCFLGVVQADASTADFARLAKLAQQNIRLQLQLESNQSSTDNLSNDETLSNDCATNSAYFQSMFEQLGQLNAEYDFANVATLVLPTLSSTINAQSIAVVPKSTSSRNAFVSVGDHVGDLAEWERIVEAHWQPISEAPVYKRVLGVAYSSIRNFVIAPIRMGETIFGWLVADIDESDGEVDQQEVVTDLMKSSAAFLASYAFADERLKQKEQLLLDVVRSLVSAIDAKDPQTCGHSVRVAIYASVVAEGLELTPRECDEVYLSGLLHDVGKIGVPEAIFHKTSSLTEEEFELVKQHPDHGWKILHRLEDLQHILPGVVHHHESYNGSGYPDQIEGEDIPLVARILAAVDAYDALTSDRPYRQGKSHGDAMNVLDEGAGIQWDPVIVETLHAVSRRMQRVSKKYRREAHPWRIPGSIAPHETAEGGVSPSTDSTIETTSRYDAYGVDRI